MQTTDSEFWSDDAAALANREAQRSIEARTGLRMPAPSSARPPEKPSTFRPAQKPVAVAAPEAKKSNAFGWFVMAAVLGLSIFVVQSGLTKSKKQQAAEQGAEGSITGQSGRELASVVNELTQSGVLLKVTRNGEFAEVYVLAPFLLADVDQKTSIVSAVYHHAFQLEPDGKPFPGSMRVYHGLTGEHLKTVDKSFRGLQW